MGEKEKYPIVLVEWYDTTFYNQIYSDREIEGKLDCSLCFNVGYLISKDKELVKLAAHYYENKYNGEVSYTDINIIPRSCVVRIKTLLDKTT